MWCGQGGGILNGNQMFFMMSLDVKRTTDHGLELCCRYCADASLAEQLSPADVQQWVEQYAAASYADAVASAALALLLRSDAPPLVQVSSYSFYNTCVARAEAAIAMDLSELIFWLLAMLLSTRQPTRLASSKVACLCLCL